MINQLVFNKSELKRCGISVIQVGADAGAEGCRSTPRSDTRIRRVRRCT